MHTHTSVDNPSIFVPILSAFVRWRRGGDPPRVPPSRYPCQALFFTGVVRELHAGESTAVHHLHHSALALKKFRGEEVVCAPRRAVDLARGDMFTDVNGR